MTELTHLMITRQNSFVLRYLITTSQITTMQLWWWQPTFHKNNVSCIFYPFGYYTVKNIATQVSPGKYKPRNKRRENVTNTFIFICETQRLRHYLSVIASTEYLTKIHDGMYLCFVLLFGLIIHPVSVFMPVGTYVECVLFLVICM